MSTLENFEAKILEIYFGMGKSLLIFSSKQVCNVSLLEIELGVCLQCHCKIIQETVSCVLTSYRFVGSIN